MYVCVHEHVCACVCMYVLTCYRLNPGMLGKCSPTVTDPQPPNLLTFFLLGKYSHYFLQSFESCSIYAVL